MRNRFGHHISGAATDNVHIVTQIGGSFEVYYGQIVDTVVVELRTEYGAGSVSIPLSVENAITLRDLIDAAVTDAKALHPHHTFSDPKEMQR
ncbi:hypothetical protein ACWDUL_32630 [Nocardia niigatensis]